MKKNVFKKSSLHISGEWEEIENIRRLHGCTDKEVEMPHHFEMKMFK